MRSGFKVGRLFGINIYIDWSWILIFLLVTWNLAEATHSSSSCDRSATAAAAIALRGTAL